ncbi:Gfo/Idh/MocA family protein [Granulicella mallensis]|uniref:Oxidoreductase domain protein n=1 Tax=Granulicella mallensis (strain ATCC BAA-1857 / DSM 23137 / MP5ACTX8) TaxID=682795 RepID=G8NXC2_GRAMM|nr:Gfo/Idh/MocA family oxidoreductase [Granulicella mallensis]AEU37829.1 oxidoreductase domain protein [Granulicella mallensis MP5ACTX8]
MAQVKVGVVGLGAWGRNVARCLHELNECDLVACCDTNPASRALAELNWNVKTCETLDEMLERYPSIQAIVISSPAITHYPLAKKALLADKDVFVEKPFTLEVAHAEELLHLSEVRDRVLMVGHLMEYHPAVNYIRDLVRSGELGDIYYVYTQRVNLGRIRGDENALWSFAPHDISQILYMLGGTPTDVSARGQSFIQKSIEDVVFLSLYFSNRVMAHIHISWLDPHKVRSTTIVGSKKMVVFDDAATSEKLRIYDSRAEMHPTTSYGEATQVRFGDIHIPRISSTEPLKIEFQHFLDCVVRRLRPRSDAYDGLQVVRILDSAQRSLDMDGIPVALQPEEERLHAPSLPSKNRSWRPAPDVPISLPAFAYMPELSQKVPQ